VSLLWCFSVVGCQPKPCDSVFCPPTATTPLSPSVGSLILHFEDGTQHKIVHDRSGQDCKVNNIPRKRITRVEVANADFILYNNPKWRGKQMRVGSVGNMEYTADEVGFTWVKSVEKQDCSRKANVPAVAVSVCVVVIILVLAGLFVLRRSKYQRCHSTSTSDQQTQENGL